MNNQTTKNYKTDNGDRTVIGGVLEFTEDAQVLNFPAGGAMRLGEGLKVEEDGSLSISLTPAENQESIETTDITRLAEAFNSLLSKLKAAGLMVPDAVEEPDDDGTGAADPDQSGGADGSGSQGGSDGEGGDGTTGG